MTRMSWTPAAATKGGSAAEAGQAASRRRVPERGEGARVCGAAGEGREAASSAGLRGSWGALGAALLCAWFCFYGIQVGNVKWGTEALRVMAAAEMLDGGSWVVPTLYHRTLVTKPPGMYWAIAAASWPVGEVTAVTSRIPSAVAGLATLVLVCWMTWRHFGRPAGLIAAMTTGATWVWLEKAVSADIEMMLVASVVGSLVFFLRGYEEQGGRAWPWWLGSYACLGVGFLMKGPAAILYFYLTVISFLLVQKDLRSLVRRWEHWAGVGIFLALAGGWVVLAAREVGIGELVEQVVPDLRTRLAGGRLEDAQWSLIGSLAHPGVLLGVTLPWSLFALAAFLPSVRAAWNEPQRRYLVFMLCFMTANVVFWSLLPPKGRNVRYACPLFPSVTCLASVIWFGWLTGRAPAGWEPRHLRIGATVLAVVLAASVGAGAYAMMTLPALRGVAVALTVAAVLVCLAGLRACWRLGGEAAAPSEVPDRGGPSDEARTSGLWVKGGLVVARWRGWVPGGDRGIVLGAFVGFWVVLKLCMVHVVTVERDFARPWAAYGRAIGTRVPEGEKLFVLHRWEAAMLFYAGRDIYELDGAEALAKPAGPKYCLLSDRERRRVAGVEDLTVQEVARLEDMWGEPMHVVMVGRKE